MNSSQINQKIENLSITNLEEFNNDKLQSELSTDIFDLSGIVQWIKDNSEVNFNKRIISVLWIENLLKNPFKINEESEKIEIIKQFLISEIKNTLEWKFRKLQIRCLSFLVNLESEECLNTSVINNNCNYQIYNTQFSEIEFYCFLKYLSKLREINRKFVIFNENDSIITKRYKIKIISNLSNINSVVDDLKTFFEMINVSDTKLGWTLCKCIYKITKLIDKPKFISDIKELLNKPIFSDEQCWINCMSVLAFMVLDNEKIGDFTFLDQIFKFESEFYYKSNLLKETAIFLIWAIVRTGKIDIKYKETCNMKEKVISDYNAVKDYDTVTSIDAVKDCNSINSIDAVKDHNTVKDQSIFNSIDAVKYCNTVKDQSIINSIDAVKDCNTVKDQSIFNSIDAFPVHNKVNSIDISLSNQNTAISTEATNDILSSHSNNRNINFFSSSSFNINSLVNSKLIYNIIYFALFDIDLNCRRASACVIQEILGRYDLFDKDCNVLSKITQESVKRRSNSLEIFKNISQKNEYFSFFERSLYSYDLETREIGAKLIANYCNPMNINIRYKSVIEMDSIHRLINHLVQLDRGIDKTFTNFVFSFNLTNQNYKLRNMNLTCSSYLRIIENFEELPNTMENVIFLATKGFNPTELCEFSNFLFKNISFSEKIFNLFNKNSTFMLLNSNNVIFKEKVKFEYLKKISNKISIDISILGLQRLKCFDSDIQEIVKVYLEDYSISFNGDIGYFNRKAALEYFCSIDSQIECISLNNYLIRYLADKSKKLRDEIIKMLLSMNLDKYKKLFPFFEYKSFYIKNESNIRKGVFEEFFKLFEELSNENDYEEAYFKTLFKLFGKNEEFLKGIRNTIETADGKLLKTLQGEMCNNN